MRLKDIEEQFETLKKSKDTENQQGSGATLNYPQIEQLAHLVKNQLANDSVTTAWRNHNRIQSVTTSVEEQNNPSTSSYDVKITKSGAKIFLIYINRRYFLSRVLILIYFQL